MNSSPIIQLINFFGKTKIMEIAQNTGLVKRQRKLLPDTIVKVFTFGLLNNADPSLKQIASKCKSVQPNLRITKQAIYKRLDKISAFLQEIFSLAIQFSIKNTVAVETAQILTQFKDVKIYDSTRISLPDKLAKVWPGLGGRNAKASLKIQASYSLLSKSIVNLELTKSPGTDTSYTEQIIAQTKEKELIITDLGYFSQSFLNSIVDQQAYFLTRIRKNTIVGTQKDGSNQSKQKKFLKLLKNKQIVDTKVFIGGTNTKQFKCRLVAIHLPEEIINERRRKANKKAKSKGKKLSKYESELLAWNIVITNVPVNMLSAVAICDLYRARWQIELIFKACKSYLKIDKVGNCGKDQLECLIYGRLIAILMSFRIYNHHYPKMYKKYDRGISILLFIKLLADESMKIAENLVSIIPSIKELVYLFKRIAEDSLYEKRKRKTTLERVMEHRIPAPDYQNSA